MKKLIALVISICALITLLAACGSNSQSAPENNTNSNDTSIAPDVTSSSNLDNDSNSDATSAIEITLPAWLFESDEDFNADIYAQEQGFDKAVVNTDGSVTISTTQAKYNQFLKGASADVETYLADLVEAENTPYIREITHNDDFSVVTVKVNREAYESAFDFTPFGIGMTTSVYQAFLEMDSHCEINMVDIETGDIIKTIIYPDAYK